MSHVAETTPAGALRQLRFQRPPGATSILLVRHGESIPIDPAKPFDLVDGHGDPPLDPVGVTQGERVAARLSRPRSGETISAIYVTTLQRTGQTAAPLAAALGIEMRVEADLREVFLGEWEGGLYRSKLAEGGPVAKQFLEGGRWDVIPGAEPEEQFEARVRAGLQRIAKAHPDELVAVFTHGGVIGKALAIASGASGRSFSAAANASISEIVVSEDRWIIRGYNDTAHLED